MSLIIPAIMSGGAGTRLWPLSTDDHPKQFQALMGPRTMFAETVARMKGDVGDISFAPPIVLCGAKHVARVRDALSEVDARASAIAIEPAARNTAAVAASAAAIARGIDVDALVLLAPSDHVIADVSAFHTAIARAAPVAENHIVTFGVTPSRAATGYGYIKRGDELKDGVFSVEAFKEKPDAQTAERYVADGGFYWNSGMFLFNRETLLAEFGANSDIRDHAIEALHNATREGDEIRLGAAYASARALPLDVAVMERTARAAVVPCDIGWADIGSWGELWRLTPRNADGFRVLGPAASKDTSKIEASGVRVATLEGDDLVVVAAQKGLLIVPRARAADANTLRDLAEKL